jgi:hypothetical protein
VLANKPNGPNAKPKDDVLTSFNRITRHASKAVGRRKKMTWVPKGGTLIKVEFITRTSTARPTLKSEPHMIFKVLLSKHTNKKANPWSHDRTWSSRRQLYGQIASGHYDHWRPHHQFPSFNMPIYGQGDSHPCMFTYFPWFGYSPWIHYDESLYFSWTIPKSYTCDWPSWPYQNCRGHATMSSALRFTLFSIAAYIEFISAMILIRYK